MVWICNYDGTKVSFDVQLLNQIEQKHNDKVLDTLRKSKDLYNTVDRSGASLLHYAAGFGNENVARSLIKSGSKINLQNKDGNTPLLLATKAHHEATIKIFLQSHANIHTCNNKGTSSLHFVLHENPPNYRIAKLFLEQLSRECSFDSAKIAKKLTEIQCPIYVAVLIENMQVIRSLLDNGYCINEKDPIFGKTALHVAVENLDSNSIRELVNLGANVNAKNTTGETALLMLKDFRDQDKVLSIIQTLLIPKARVTSCNNEGFMQIFRVLQYGSCEAIRIGLNFLHCNYSIADENDRNLIHYLALNSNVACIKLIADDKNCDIHGIDVNARDCNGFTALHYAISAGNASFVKYLINKGANVRVTENEGPSFFLQAIDEQVTSKNTLENRVECVKFLLKGKSYPEVMLSQYFKIYNTKSAINRDFALLEPVIEYLAMKKVSETMFDEDILQKIDLYPELKKYFDVCTLELEKMKNEKICKNLTMFDVLVWQSNFPSAQIFFKVRSWQMQNRVNKYQFIKTYHEILEKRVTSITGQEIMPGILIAVVVLLFFTFYMKVPIEFFICLSALQCVIGLSYIIFSNMTSKQYTNEPCRDCSYRANNLTTKFVALDFEDKQ